MFVYSCLIKQIDPIDQVQYVDIFNLDMPVSVAIAMVVVVMLVHAFISILIIR
jgi:hypothetical protein